MQTTPSNYPYIVADIGGTNSRFGVVTATNLNKSEFTVENLQTYSSAEFDCLEQVVDCYQQTLSDYSIKGACLAVAGPVAGDCIKLTNLNWDIDVPAAAKHLGLANLHIINDFAAYAYAIQYINNDNLLTINRGSAILGSPVAVLGPGTGFGVAALLKQAGSVNVLASEGGHMSLAANTALQFAIKEHLSQKYALVSIERVFSGPGLRHLYRAFCAVEGKAPLTLSTAQISQCGVEGSDEMCRRTLALFCSWLGSVTGDLALALGARGGVFLGGGILPRIADFLLASDFYSAFKDKDQVSQYLEDIPVHLVTEGNSALLGAAAWYEDYAG